MEKARTVCVAVYEGDVPDPARLLYWRVETMLLPVPRRPDPLKVSLRSDESAAGLSLRSDDSP